MRHMILEQWASVNYTEFQYASVSIGENWGYQNNIVSDSSFESPLWIILSFEFWINHNNYEAHDFGTMGLCELYWISICLCEHRGKLRSSKQHRFGLIFWFFLFFCCLSLLSVFACFCLCFWFCFWFVLLVCVSISNKNNDTHPSPSRKKIYTNSRSSASGGCYLVI